jgi:predicted RNA polymerase sigma factor
MAARLTRAKKKIAAAGVPFRVPGPDELPRRLGGVLAVVHLVLTTGHTAPTGAALLRDDLLDRAHDLARLLRSRFPDDPDVAGLLALVLLTAARRGTRTGPDGELVLLADQDRSRWDRTMIDEGRALVRAALPARPVSRYAVLAAVAAVHADAPSFDDTDWTEIVGLYDVVLARWPSPVVALNRAVAIGFADGPDAGLAALDALADEPRLAGYGYLAAARAELLRRVGRPLEARTALEEAALLTANDVERELLARRLEALG